MTEVGETYEKMQELQTMMSDFVSNVLQNKPDDVYAFAHSYFSTFHVPKESQKTHVPVVITGPSGVGKGTLIDKLLKKYPEHFGFSVSHTTRQPRKGEEHGKHYFFTDVPTMKKEIEQGKFIEYAEVHSNFYGTSKAAVERVQQEGKICILDIDVQGCEQVKKSSLIARYLFIAPPSVEELETRLRGRGSETEESVQRRLNNARKELEYKDKPGFFDHVLVNDDLEKSFKEMENWILRK